MSDVQTLFTSLQLLPEQSKVNSLSIGALIGELPSMCVSDTVMYESSISACKVLTFSWAPLSCAPHCRWASVSLDSSALSESRDH